MPTLIQQTFDAYAKRHDFTKKSGSWYLRRPETILVLNLQKSQYASRYYVNVAIWLLPLEEADFPKPWKCHLSTRLDALAEGESDQINSLLDLTQPIPDLERSAKLTGVLESILAKVIDLSANLERLRSPEASSLLSNMIIFMGPAQELLGIRV